MRIQVSDERLTIEATDRSIVGLGRAALESLGDQAGEDGVIAGDLPVSASFSDLWQALKESLEDMIRRAAPGSSHEKEEPSGQADPDPSVGPKTGTDDA